MKLVFIDRMLAIFLALSWVIAFSLMVAGYYLYEPTKFIAIGELILSSSILIYTVLRLVMSFKTYSKGIK